MGQRDRERRKGKDACCGKPLRKACKSCPRRRRGTSEDEPPRRDERPVEEPPDCPLSAWRLA